LDSARILPVSPVESPSASLNKRRGGRQRKIVRTSCPLRTKSSSHSKATGLRRLIRAPHPTTTTTRWAINNPRISSAPYTADHYIATFFHLLKDRLHQQLLHVWDEHRFRSGKAPHQNGSLPLSSSYLAQNAVAALVASHPSSITALTPIRERAIRYLTTTFTKGHAQPDDRQHPKAGQHWLSQVTISPTIPPRQLPISQQQPTNDT
jgi:hypothetical protein